MNQVINLRAYTRPSNVPTLVLVDLQHEQVATLSPTTALAEVFANCCAVLQRARTSRLPVAFARLIPRSQFAGLAPPSVRWIDGFTPTRTDMIFDRDKPSCYSSPEFSDVIGQGNRHFVLAGLTGEAACLSTGIDAFHHGPKVTFLSDASASRAAGSFNAAETHRAVTELITLYASVVATAEWVAACDRTVSKSVRG